MAWRRWSAAPVWGRSSNRRLPLLVDTLNQPFSQSLSMHILGLLEPSDLIEAATTWTQPASGQVAHLRSLQSLTSPVSGYEDRRVWSVSWPPEGAASNSGRQHEDIAGFDNSVVMTLG